MRAPHPVAMTTQSDNLMKAVLSHFQEFRLTSAAHLMPTVLSLSPPSFSLARSRPWRLHTTGFRPVPCASRHIEGLSSCLGITRGARSQAIGCELCRHGAAWDDSIGEPLGRFPVFRLSLPHSAIRWESALLHRTPGIGAKQQRILPLYSSPPPT